jgi:tricorn protease
MNNNDGYLRFPALTQDKIIFVAEDDLWQVPNKGGVARRLTNTPGTILHPYISPDQQSVAYSSCQEGAFAVFVMPSDGGEASHLTYHPEHCIAIGWMPDSENIIFHGPLDTPHMRRQDVYTVSRHGGPWQKMSLGPATSVAFAADSDHVCLQRGYADPAVWKRYRGGRIGQLWYGSYSRKSFTLLSKDGVAEANPFLYQDRIYFVSDRDGRGNIYSYKTDGSDLQQHTFHRDFYVRWPSHHESKVVYQLGGELWLLDLKNNKTRHLNIRLQNCVYAHERKFVSPAKYLQGYSLSPKGDTMLINSRGQLVVLPLWKGAMRIVGPAQGVRHKLCRWLPDSHRIIAVHDGSGEEELVIYDLDKEGAATQLGAIGTGGYVQQVLPSPKGDKVAVAISSQLYLLALDGDRSLSLVDESSYRYFADFCWSPDGRWLAYTKFQGEPNYGSLFLYHVQSQKTTQISAGNSHDYSPSFDPQGRYLYFLSKRVFNPYEDSLQVAYSFPATAKPYLIVLKSLTPSPFSAMAELTKDDKKEKEDKKEGEKDAKNGKEAGKEQDVIVDIDLAGIETRVQDFPVQEGRFVALTAIKDKILLLKRPVVGELGEPTIWEEPDKSRCQLLVVNLKDPKEEVLANDISGFSLNHPYQKMVLRVGYRLRVVTAGEELPKESEGKPGVKNGWFDFERVKVMVEPKAEWQQIFHEGWRWQRDFYWRADMGGVDWQAVRSQYQPLLARIRTRDELSDLLWEMQGELGTSHAYVMFGDVPLVPSYRIGSLGADLEFDEAAGKYRFARIYTGDPFQKDRHSPLIEPGIEVTPGTYLLAINGHVLEKGHHPYEELVALAGSEVLLKVAKSSDGKDSREVVVTALRSEVAVRYPQWVEDNRRYVAEKTGGRVGYVHLPDMQLAGLIAFHRDFLWQFHKDGLIFDVRYNGGGRVSPIFLAKLQSKVIGYSKPRYGALFGYPYKAIRGPVVSICNEYTGSDGDIFCQAFKDMRLGTLVGKRTWGGVVGILADKRLVDGGILTQPEFAFWFHSEGWRVENHGVDPDIVVEDNPSDYHAGRDTQLDCAIEVILKQLGECKEKPKPEL